MTNKIWKKMRMRSIVDGKKLQKVLLKWIWNKLKMRKVKIKKKIWRMSVTKMILKMQTKQPSNGQKSNGHLKIRLIINDQTHMLIIFLSLFIIQLLKSNITKKTKKNKNVPKHKTNNLIITLHRRHKNFTKQAQSKITIYPFIQSR